ncbi:MAG: hypothetical protein NTZ28_05915, partial [Nitrospirae bacterium]|nr:hypothetical protein [Nitrospirota bacterium]
IKKALRTLGPMRPGSITQQYRLPKERRRPFYQVSYTHRMRSRSEYIRPENLDALRKETANFKRFKTLIARWVALALAASQLRVQGCVADGGKSLK